MASSSQREQHLRQATVAWALRRHGPGAGALFAHHPQAKALKARLTEATQPDLADLLWAELPLIEAAAGIRAPKSGDHETPARRPIDYCRRRFRAALRDEWRWLLAELPNLWRVLIDLSPTSVEELALLLGLEILSQAAFGQPEAKMADILSSLDETYARQLLTRVKELKAGGAVPAELAQSWDHTARRAMQKREGWKLLRWLALTLLANLLALLPSERMRVAATRHCRSDLFNVLALGGRAEFVTPQHQAAVEAMVLQVLGRLRPGQESASDSF